MFQCRVPGRVLVHFTFIPQSTQTINTNKTNKKQEGEIDWQREMHFTNRGIVHVLGLQIPCLRHSFFFFSFHSLPLSCFGSWLLLHTTKNPCDQQHSCKPGEKSVHNRASARIKSCALQIWCFFCLFVCFCGIWEGKKQTKPPPPPREREDCSTPLIWSLCLLLLLLLSD